MECQLCVGAHAAHIGYAWLTVSKHGDWQDKQLVLALLAFSVGSYIVVGSSEDPVLANSFGQALMAISFLLHSGKISGNVTGALFALMVGVGGLTLAGYIDGRLWQGISFNYWNYSAIVTHIALFLSWKYANGANDFRWLLD